MIILGIEAAAKICGAAVWKDGHLLAEERTFGELTHSETLLPMVKTVLDGCGLSVQDLSYIALTSGPGSFTGLRIGAACAKGLALGQARTGEDGYLYGGIPLIPVPTLESLAFGAFSDLTREYLFVPVMDARRHQVYGAVYGTDAQGMLAERIPGDAVPPQVLADKLLPFRKPCLLLGDASELYVQVFRDKLGNLARLAPEVIRNLSAAATCRLAAYKLSQAAEGLIPSPAIPGDQLTLRYLRKPQAEREREQRLAAGKTL